MASKAQNKKWALDTNVILDLGRRVDAALSLKEIAAEHGYSLIATHTVLQELFHLADFGDQELRKRASSILQQFPGLSITPLTLDSSQKAIAAEFSNFIRSKGALPNDEVNDGRILAEASLADAALLVSSDSHLVSIDRDELRMLFEFRDLTSIPVITPRKILRLFEKWRRSSGG